MMNFNFASATYLRDELNRIISISHKNMRFVEDNGGYSDARVRDNPQNKEALEQSISAVIFITSQTDNLFSSLRSPHLDQARQNLRTWLSNPIHEMRWSELNTRSRVLRDALETELKQFAYYHYSKEFTELLAAWETEWGPVISTFDDTKIEIFSAVDLLGLDHPTSSVFHLMRVLEHGLRWLASEVGLTFDIQQWHNIIEEIEGKITRERKTLPSGMPRAERLRFLSEAAKEFFYFKDGWRNYVSHGRAT